TGTWLYPLSSTGHLKSILAILWTGLDTPVDLGRKGWGERVQHNAASYGYPSPDQ
ncbi:hypothetical protein BgiMline_015111, partial [Biomphalaria glabrata]